MKLIVAGSTGFVGKEVIRQALRYPTITSVVALARRTITVPEDAGIDTSKLKCVVCDDFENYSEDVKKELVGADACIWLVAITPAKLNTMPFAEVEKICLDYTVKGIETMSPIASKPFRFIYVSGVNAERDQNKKPFLMGNYSLMRGKTESLVLEYAKESSGAVEACVAKPGLIDAPGHSNFVQGIMKSVLCAVVGLPRVELNQIASTLIQQAVTGIEKETLLNEDLVRIGSKVLEERGLSS
ncbi:putative nucleoside-diphosphate-sugar epimerase [Mollisia scopiformis]|uniref:Putative nucleoside-diphosphate-sugar epimerase n=1 Tax=Mollisia scopiformis TaxID=149040 RepID=A0A194X0M0_MOLSC|nr:putative nucleoside-diphosphate-sugar epimerase [Mollisia scopiformis]KUJ13417.1 putative nucleoside-diphosphate-sugar epimerase [Mollisia scopiformis]